MSVVEDRTQTLRLQLMALEAYLSGVEHGQHAAHCPVALGAPGSCTCDALLQETKVQAAIRAELEDFIDRVRERAPRLAAVLREAGAVRNPSFGKLSDPGAKKDMMAAGMETMKLLAQVALFVLDSSERHEETCAKVLVRSRCTCGWDAAAGHVRDWKALMETAGCTFETTHAEPSRA